MREVAARATKKKQPAINLYVGYPLFEEIEKAVALEPVRGPSAFALACFRVGFKHYQRVGSLRAMKEIELTPSGRISQETYEQLLSMVRIIVDRAPSAVIEDLVRYLNGRAGKYGESK